MIVVRLKGGMGNQMFQYALGRVLSIKNNTELVLDTSFLHMSDTRITKREYSLGFFAVQAEIKNSNYFSFFKNKLAFLVDFFLRILSFKVLREKGFSFDKNVFYSSKNIFLDGYWQSYKYFDGYEDRIRKDFTLKEIPENIKVLARDILNRESVCIHVRRGDYVGNIYHEVVDMEYYKRGIEKIRERSTIEKIYVFSDDIDWCKANMSFSYETVFVNDTYSGKVGEYHLYLMSCCKNFIIPNSSFSWWGAWLALYSNKIVVVPKRWFNDDTIDTNDLIPKDWIRI